MDPHDALQWEKLPDEANMDELFAMGIDEAGRGPVLGPMVYGCAFCPIKDKDNLQKLKVADSKTLTEYQREILFTKMKNTKYVGWMVEVLDADELSMKMLKLSKINLNTISHDAAITLIRRVLAKGIKLKEIFVDTVGVPSKYQAKLEQLFPDIEITVSKKADSLFPVVSAASICAKVIRDHRLKNWKFKEQRLEISHNFGSGYPSDPTTKRWLQQNLDPVFGYPSLIRFSWKTCSAILKKSAVPVQWDLYGEEEDEGYSSTVRPIKDKADRYRFFAENNMELVMDF